jgi:hypothetical protein
MDVAKIKEHLAEADAHIADGKARIIRQREIVAKCSAAGIGITDAERQLAEACGFLRWHLRADGRVPQ